ncbi:MAG: AAA family ATPase [Cyanobacteria bacterium P01_E01_bin.42]
MIDRHPESKDDKLEKYWRELTDLARDGKLNPAIGRDEEIHRTIQVLSRRAKNNLILIGESRDAKTAIVEGLAQQIIHKDVPDVLKDRRVFALNMKELVTEAANPDEFGECLKAVLEKVTEDKEKIILFIDEIHRIIDEEASQKVADAFNFLKPMLPRGELQYIGATTPDEYRNRLEKDGVFGRRFQAIMVDEATADASKDFENH